MDPAVIHQATLQLKKSNNTAIVLAPEPSPDALAAALALLTAITQDGRQAKIICPKIQPHKYSFHPHPDSVGKGLRAEQDFIISLSLNKTQAGALRYEIKDNTLQIIVTPKNGAFTPEDVTATPGPIPYTCVVVIEVQNLSQLGTLHQDNIDFFYHTPILNIDHQPHNTHYGHINLVDITASSASEIVFELISQLNTNTVNADVATSLLAGIISKTKAYQSKTVTPRALAISSHLVGVGARRDDIIRELYQTKNIPTLQLWGHALSRIQSTKDGTVVWSSLTASDLQQSGTQATAAAGVLDELMINTPSAHYACLFIENNNATDVFVLSQKTFEKVEPPLIASSPTFATGSFPGNTEETTKRVIETLSKTI